VTELGPQGIRISKKVTNQIASETFAANLKPGVFLSVDGMTVYVESINKKTKDFENFFVLDQRQDQSAVVFSKLGKIVNQENVGSFLRMEQGQIHYSPKETNHAVIDFQEYNFLTDSSSETNLRQPLKAMTNAEIKKHPLYLKGDFKYRLEIHKRWQLSLVCIVFLALGIAFGFNVFQRVSRSESLGFCMFLSMAYWVLYFVFESFAGNAKLIAIIYIPNLLFLLIAILWMKYRNDTFSEVFKFRR
jgi:lipopolysaccharide export LptBFGC system permease protein LptF